MEYLDGLARESRGDVELQLETARQGLMNAHHYTEALAQMNEALALFRSAGAATATLAQALSALANAQRQSGNLDAALAAIAEG